MAIDLKKGSKINLKKETSPAGGKVFIVGLGWDPDASASPHPIDLDASCFLVGYNAKLVSDEYFVFYNNPTSPDGSVIYSGDNRSGVGDGDDETLVVDTSKINPTVQQVVFCCSINEAEERGQTFRFVNNAYIRIYEQNTGQLIATYMLNEAASNETAFILGRLINTNEGWEFEPYPIGYQGGLSTLVDIYS